MSARARSLLTVIALTGAMGSIGAAPATGNTIRTDTALGGFSIFAEAAPLKILLDDPTIPIPRPEDSPILEADPSYSAAYLDTGPNSRAVGSTLWPGGLIGTGLPQVAAGAPQYPVKAEARYPDKPYTATAQDGGALMNASALGLDVVGSARGVPKAAPGVVDIGAISSTSTATITKDVAVGTAVSKISDIDLAGVIHIGSVSTTVVTRSDGKTPTSSGSTVVSGLTIAGQGFTVDDKGVHAAGQVLGLPALTADPLKALGITIDGIVQESSKTVDTATRSARGLRISIDTQPLRTLLSPVLGPLNGPLGDLIAKLPKAQQGNLYYLLSATPKITFILGAGTSSAAATQALKFDFAPPDNPGVLPPTVSNPGGPPSINTSGDLPGLGLPGTAPSMETPQIDSSGLSPRAATGFPGGLFHGVAAGLVLGAALLAGLGGWGLVRLQGLALTGGLIRPGCGLGAPSTLPDLHGA
ncbi:MAG: hypothetical protein JWM02_2009 [Frankiales bacterium]|nr:hypothetical protein [Frankiales bacterium]